MQEIVINVNKQNDKIVGLVENGKLVEKYEELGNQNRLEGNIYIGKVENVLLGMQAAFIDIGEGKNTFIHNSPAFRVQNTIGTLLVTKGTSLMPL